MWVDSITDEQLHPLVYDTLHLQASRFTRQSLTQSGNAIYRIDLPDDRSLALRISPKPKSFAYTAKNLAALSSLGLPVQSVLSVGPTQTGGSYILLNWLPGRDLLYALPTMSTAQMNHIAESIVDIQRRVGTLPMSRGFGWAPIGKNAAISAWTDIFGPAPTAAEHLSRHLSTLDRLRARLRNLRFSLEPYFASIQPTCFLDDLTTKNALIEDAILTGIIDLDYVCYGDPLMSVGTTLATLAAESGLVNPPYAQVLLNCWSPTTPQRRSINFYAALWLIGLLTIAQSTNDTSKLQELSLIADALLSEAETP